MSKINFYSFHLAAAIVLLSLVALLINQFFFQFPGNNFFPGNVFFMVITLILINLGLFLLLGKNSRASRIGIEFCYFFAVMSIIALASNAVQFTPFSPIDKVILRWENFCSISIPALLTWLHVHPSLLVLLGLIYDTLPYQMSILPCLTILTGRFQRIHDYYFLLLFSTLFGFAFYYFFPTTAPASIIDSPYFSVAQHATGLKFYQIHHYIVPTTAQGGLIALPSFHTIWALFCVFLVKEWKIAFGLLLTINVLLIASCILLGWHYPLDILAGLFIVELSFRLLPSSPHQSRKRH